MFELIHDNVYDKIVDNLYLGSASALDYHKNFSMIVNCTYEIPFPTNFKHCYRIAVNDDPDDSHHFLQLVETTNILEKINASIIKQKPVLLHCFSGVQRSASLTALYLIKYHNMKPYSAIDYIRRHRPIAFFNQVNFIHALETFYKKQLSKKMD